MLVLDTTAPRRARIGWEVMTTPATPVDDSPADQIDVATETTAERRARFEREAGGAWHYTVTLTQNLNRGAVSKGQMRFIVDGVRGGKLATVQWDELVQTPDAPGKPFSFRYFQQIASTTCR